MMETKRKVTTNRDTLQRQKNNLQKACSSMTSMVHYHNSTTMRMVQFEAIALRFPMHRRALTLMTHPSYPTNNLKRPQLDRIETCSPVPTAYQSDRRLGQTHLTAGETRELQT
jgi:hypothetical protein